MRNELERSKLALYQEVMELRERKEIFISHRMYLDELLNNLVHGFSTYFTARKNQVDALAQRLIDLNPEYSQAGIQYYSEERHRRGRYQLKSGHGKVMNWQCVFTTGNSALLLRARLG